MEIRRICDKFDALEMSKAGILEDFINSRFPSTSKTSLREIKELRQVADLPLKSAKEILSGEDVTLEIGDDVRIQRYNGGTLRLIRRIGGLWISEPIDSESTDWATVENLFPQWKVKELCSQSEIESQSRKGDLRSYLAKLFISFDRNVDNVWYRVGDHMVWHYQRLCALVVYGGDDVLTKNFCIYGYCRSYDVENLVNLVEDHVTGKAFGPF